MYHQTCSQMFWLRSLRAAIPSSSFLPSRCTADLSMRGMAAAASAKVVPAKEDKSFVDTKAEKLASHVCINFHIQGEEPGPKIRPDSEYPAWLFELDLRPKMELEDLDPEKDGWLYWRSLRKRQIEQNRRIQKLKTRFLHIQGSPSMKQK